MKRIIYKVESPERLIIQIFNPWHGIIPVFLILATSLATIQSVLNGSLVFAFMQFVVLLSITISVIHFLGLRHIDFDREAGTVALKKHYLMRKEERVIGLADIDHVVFTFKPNAEAGGSGFEVTPDTKVVGNYSFYVGLRLLNGEKITVYAEKGTDVITLGHTIRRWFEVQV